MGLESSVKRDLQTRSILKKALNVSFGLARQYTPNPSSSCQKDHHCDECGQSFYALGFLKTHKINVHIRCNVKSVHLRFKTSSASQERWKYEKIFDTTSRLDFVEATFTKYQCTLSKIETAAAPAPSVVETKNWCVCKVCGKGCELPVHRKKALLGIYWHSWT